MRARMTPQLLAAPQPRGRDSRKSRRDRARESLSHVNTALACTLQWAGLDPSKGKRIMTLLQLPALRAGALSLCVSASVASAQTLPPPPPADGNFDYQLGGSYPAAPGVHIVSRDVTDGASKSDDIYDICYLNALQTQPSETSWWKKNHPELLLKDRNGDFVRDPDPRWGEEILFDVGTPERQHALIEIQQAWIDKCANGFDAIEPDNIDSYDRAPDGLLSQQSVADYMKLFVEAAHERNLAVAQKNIVEWNAGFDFAIIEECQLFNECDGVIEQYGASKVFEIEYWYDEPFRDDGVSVPAHSRAHFDAACDARGRQIRIVIRNDDVRAKGEDGYYFDTCDARLSR